MEVIDAFTHYCPPDYLKQLKKYALGKSLEVVERQGEVNKRFPNFVDVQTRLDEMRKYRIDLQATNIIPTLDPSIMELKDGGKQRGALIRQANDQMAEISERSHDEIIPMGVVPLVSQDDAGSALDEMKRAVRDLGLKGFQVPSNVDGKAIDTFGHVWEGAAALDVPVYIHPNNTPASKDRPYEHEYDLMHVFGWPFETTLILSRLVFSGIMEKTPKLKVIAHHLGGMIPFYEGRIEETYTRASGASTRPWLIEKLKEDALSYFRRFYYDTAVGNSSTAIKCGYGVFGAGQIVFATDYPYGPDGGRKRLAEYPKTVRELGLKSDEEEKIFSGNMRKMLKIK